MSVTTAHTVDKRINDCISTRGEAVHNQQAIEQFNIISNVPGHKDRFGSLIQRDLYLYAGW
jgi:hypothetical protein